MREKRVSRSGRKKFRPFGKKEVFFLGSPGLYGETPPRRGINFRAQRTPPLKNFPEVGPLKTPSRLALGIFKPWK